MPRPHPLLIALACLPLATLAGCGDTATAAPDGTGSNAGASAPASAAAWEPAARPEPLGAAPGTFVDLGNGVEVALLARLQAPAGTDNIGAGKLAEAWHLRLRNTADGPRPFPDDRIAFEYAGRPQKPDAFMALEGGGSDHFSRERGGPLVRLPDLLHRMMPGQEVDGWLFPEVPAADAAGEAALLLTSERILLEVSPASVAVRLPAAAGAEADLATAAAPAVNLQADEPLGGGATIARYLGTRSAPSEIDPAIREVEVDLSWTNTKGEEVSRFRDPSPAASVFVTDDRGRVWQHAHGRSFRGMPMKLAPGETTETLVTFRVPADATGLRLLADGSFGYRDRKEERPLYRAAPFGVWSLE